MVKKAIEQPHRRLIMFGRYPVPGKTKTRLIPAIGTLGAAELHRRMTEKTLAILLTYGRSHTPVEFCYTGATQSKVRRWLGSQPIRLSRQNGGDLGQRMRQAIFYTMDQGCWRVVLVGTDIPQLTATHIEAAFEFLDQVDLVLGPSEDGGYWLVGLRCKADIFKGINWGSADVLDQTHQVARNLGISVKLLTPLNDLDTEADLKRCLPAKMWQRPYLSVIIPTFNEAGTIEAVIRSVQSTDCEIIVSDGGSTDRTVEIARACGARVITGARGRAEQQNAAAAIATGRVLMFLHADTLMPHQYGEQVFSALLDHQVVAGAFRLGVDYQHWGMRIIEKCVQIRSALFQMPYGDQALFLSRSRFISVGGFPSVPIAEDLFLVRRLGRLGRIALASDAVITSGRRWRNMGIWRATFINYVIAIGCIAGINPKKLAPIYRLWIK